MGDAAKVIGHNGINIEERSPLIKKMIKALETIGNVQVSIDGNIEAQTEIGISAPLVDVANSTVYFRINDGNNSRKSVPISISYNPSRTNETRVINQIDMFRRHEFSEANIAKEIASRPPINDMVKILESYDNDVCKLMRNLTIGRQLVNTRIHAPNRTGFFRVRYDPCGKDLAGVMIDKEHPYRGIPFHGKVHNMHFGRMIKSRLEGYRVITWRGIE